MHIADRILIATIIVFALFVIYKLIPYIMLASVIIIFTAPTLDPIANYALNKYGNFIGKYVVNNKYIPLKVQKHLAPPC
jgi:hypothetical protein